MACYVHPSSRIALLSTGQKETTLALRATSDITAVDFIWECFGVSDIVGCSISARSFAGPVRLLDHDCAPNCCVSCVPSHLLILLLLRRCS